MNKLTAGVQPEEAVIAAVQEFDFTGGITMRMGRVVQTLTRCVDEAVWARALVPRYRVIAPEHGYVRQLPASITGVYERFAELTDRWVDDTQFESSFVQMFTHEAYLEMLTLGPSAIPLLLMRLDDEPERWVGALRIISREAIGAEAKSADEAVNAWRAWGQQHGYWA
jgi:hypothetical protein